MSISSGRSWHRISADDLQELINDSGDTENRWADYQEPKIRLALLELQEWRIQMAQATAR